MEVFELGGGGFQGGVVGGGRFSAAVPEEKAGRAMARPRGGDPTGVGGSLWGRVRTTFERGACGDQSPARGAVSLSAIAGNRLPGSGRSRGAAAR